MYPDSALTYMSVLLVELQVGLLQNMVWIANVLLDRHGLHDVQNNNYDDVVRLEMHPYLLRLAVCALPSLLPSPLRENPSSSTPPVFPRRLSGSYR